MRNTTNSVLENDFFSKLGRFINPLKSRFSIEENNKLATTFIPKSSETNPLPIGTIAVSKFKEILETEARFSNYSFLIEISLNKDNCSFLTDSNQRDLAIDCLKTVINKGLSEKAYTFSPSEKIYLLFTNVSADVAIHKANMAFRQVQKMLRTELDFNQSLVELNMYKVQDDVPDIF